MAEEDLLCSKFCDVERVEKHVERCVEDYLSSSPVPTLRVFLTELTIVN